MSKETFEDHIRKYEPDLIKSWRLRKAVLRRDFEDGDGKIKWESIKFEKEGTETVAKDENSTQKNEISQYPDSGEIKRNFKVFKHS